jgi:hypothetical protein
VYYAEQLCGVNLSEAGSYASEEYKHGGGCQRKACVVARRDDGNVRFFSGDGAEEKTLVFGEQKMVSAGNARALPLKHALNVDNGCNIEQRQ